MGMVQSLHRDGAQSVIVQCIRIFVRVDTSRCNVVLLPPLHHHLDAVKIDSKLQKPSIWGTARRAPTSATNIIGAI
jgi:hypothetical protein